MITVTAMKWAPAFAAGNVRDHRVRWILQEVGWPYRVRLLDAPTMASPAYRLLQPFAQVPCLLEDDRPPMFESGAIVIDVATRAGRLLPPEGAERSLVVGWVIAALNSVEPSLMNVAEVEYFLQDEAAKAQRRPLVVAAARQRLEQTQQALTGRSYLVGETFTVADLMLASVLKIARGLQLLDDFPALAAYQHRCLDRPAYRRAVQEQRAEICQHSMADMRYDQKEKHDA
ncbi:glutathione S-transferase family protein [Xylophilus sp. GOD-11R]|uniref:glutathione S-transferase family protein n=1 Tax=Xylophilus sp. GOD-11R TaxID=3089814 RepID=UPI00298C8963|nr:glutathione S-transferase family protein [Xylophilus sp. GOD-11R]WPB58420.1 glutathione S-transferase family protein [Xylophilus sp. GOD-11R]